MSGAPASEDLPVALQAAWQRSDLIFGLVSEPALLARPIALRQPFLFYVGHLPAFAWNHLWRGVLARPAPAPAFDELFERGIDPPDDAELATPDDAAAWPAAGAVLAYRDQVRQELRPLLDDPRLQEVLPMVLEHELMHQETLLYMLQQLPAKAKRAPSDWLPASAVAAAPARQRIRIPAGRARLGAPRDGRFRWDNEYDEHELNVPAFEIDSTPVTNRQFRELVEDGGYADRRLWTEDGWRWIEDHRLAAPRSWIPVGDDWRVTTLFGDAPFKQAADWPACVSHCEALAFARRRGARLPSEAEFHRAAFATPEGRGREHPWGQAPPGPEHGNLGFRRWGPTPVGAHPAGASAFGVHELVGNGWEWTATPFRPFPGFQPLPRYLGYSADFFDERHFVLLGGSWATDLRLVRRSFRNWFQPHYAYVFAKFRCAVSA